MKAGVSIPDKFYKLKSVRLSEYTRSLSAIETKTYSRTSLEVFQTYDLSTKLKVLTVARYKKRRNSWLRI